MILDQEQVMSALPAYEIGGELGRGGWAIVLEGRHRQLDREVAIKELPRAFSADPSVKARFIAEAQLLASLDHPHIVPVFDFVEHDGLMLLVMERLTGGTLWHRFTTTGVSMGEGCAVVLATCAALDCAHAHGVLHRDIKPENILFSGTGMVKVTDFGIAKMLGGGSTMATRAGEVVGTPAYMAPEQAEGRELGPPTDIYATATMLYELLSGRLPFPEDDNALGLLYRHVHDEPEPLGEAAPNVPAVVARVVMRGLAISADDRYRTAEEFGIALAEAGTTAWGPGWLEASTIPVMATGRMLAATTQQTAAPQTVSRPAPVTVASKRATAAPAVRPVEPAPRPAAISDLDRPLELVPVQEVVRRPPVPVAHLALASGLMVVSVVVAFVGLGSPARGGTIPRSAITVDGVAASQQSRVRLDLSKPLDVAVSVPPPLSADAIEVAFSAAGIPLGSARGAANRSRGLVRGSIDASGSRLLAAGKTTAAVRLLSAGQRVAEGKIGIRSSRSWLATVPGPATIAALLFLVAYAESLMRSLRRGRKRVVATPGLAGIGGGLGIVVVSLAWVSGSAEPAVVTIVVCALLGAGAGWAAAESGWRMRRRRRRRVS